MMPVLSPGEIGRMTVEAVGELSARAIGEEPIASYVEQEPMPWSVIEQGGWDVVGAPEAGATLVDLVYVARAWGQTCIPLPLIVTVMTKRWSAEARDHQGPVTLAVTDVSSPAEGRIPFGRADDLRVLRSLGDGLAAVPVGAEDNYAPSLPTVDCSWVSELTAEAITELAAVWAAEATGCAERVLAMSVQYAQERHQFGKPIGSFQAVKHRLSDMKVLAEAAESAVLWAAVEPDDTLRAVRWALDSSLTVAEHAVQIHGGMGFTWEMGIHYYLRHIMTLRELVKGLRA